MRGQRQAQLTIVDAFHESFRTAYDEDEGVEHCTDPAFSHYVSANGNFILDEFEDYLLSHGWSWDGN